MKNEQLCNLNEDTSDRACTYIYKHRNKIEEETPMGQMCEVDNIQLKNMEIYNPNEDTSDKPSQPGQRNIETKLKKKHHGIIDGRWTTFSLFLKIFIILGSFVVADVVFNGVDVALDIVLDVVLDALAVALDGPVLGTVGEELDGVDTVTDVLVCSVGLLDFVVDEPDKPVVHLRSINGYTIRIPSLFCTHKLKCSSKETTII